jgi:hypothetical protein
MALMRAEDGFEGRANVLQRIVLTIVSESDALRSAWAED